MDIELAAEVWLGDCQYCLVDEDQMLFYTPINEEMSAVQYSSREWMEARSGGEDSRPGRGLNRRPAPSPESGPTPVPPAPESNPSSTKE